MNSVRDLPKEGLPHSDIRGSTIARISPRLFAACHVLHRLLVPRHPPNALVTLAITQTPPARSTKPRPSKNAGNNKSRYSTTRPASAEHVTQPIPYSPVKEQTTHTDQLQRMAVLEAGPTAEASASHTHAGNGPPQQRRSGHHPNEEMEANGFEPMTPCLQSRCSTN